MPDNYENPFITDRKRRIDIIRKMLLGMGRTEIKKAVAIVVVNLGISKGNAVEIINLLIDAGSFKNNKGIIEPIDDSKDTSLSSVG